MKAFIWKSKFLCRNFCTSTTNPQNSKILDTLRAIRASSTARFIATDLESIVILLESSSLHSSLSSTVIEDIAGQLSNVFINRKVVSHIFPKDSYICGTIIRLLNGLLLVGYPYTAFNLVKKLIDEDHYFALRHIFIGKPTFTFRGLHQGSSDNSSRILRLSDLFTDKVYKRLSLLLDTKSVSHEDLSIAIFSFSNYAKSSIQHRLLEAVEASFLASSDKFNITELASIMHCYGTAGRYHDSLLSEVDRRIKSEVLQNNLENLSQQQLIQILHANARLGLHREYNLTVSMRLLSGVRGDVQRMPLSSLQQLSRILWCLACLQMLKKDHLVLLEGILSRVIDNKTSFVVRQAYQSLAELYHHDAAVERSYNAGPLHTTLFKRALSYNTNMKITNTLVQMSSWTHQDVSAQLRSEGIVHDNEVAVGFGYTVDILIPAYTNLQVLLGIPKSWSLGKGLVIEIDGPSHFESYLSKPLGSTLMKRRHLVDRLGYRLAVISYKDYDIKYSKDMKTNILRNAITNAVRVTGDR